MKRRMFIKAMGMLTGAALIALSPIKYLPKGEEVYDRIKFKWAKWEWRKDEKTGQMFGISTLTIEIPENLAKKNGFKIGDEWRFEK